jgi:hypothetical protein
MTTAPATNLAVSAVGVVVVKLVTVELIPSPAVV